MASKWSIGPTVCAAVLALPLVVGTSALANDPPVKVGANASRIRQPAADDHAAFADAMRKSSEFVVTGGYGDAAPWSAAAAGLAEKLYGPDSVETAVALHNDGFVLRRLKRDAEAEPRFARALAIYERQLPPVHEDIRNAVGELGEIYVATGRSTLLARTLQRLVDLAAAGEFSNNTGHADLLVRQGITLRGLRQLDASEAAFVKAASIYEANGEITGRAYEQTLNAILDRFETTRRRDEANLKAEAAIEQLSKAQGPKTADAQWLIGGLRSRLFTAATEAGADRLALSHAKAGLSAVEQALAGGRKVTADAINPRANALSNMARAYRGLADYKNAEQAYGKAIKLLEDGGDTANAGILIDDLAVLFSIQNRFDEAERYHKRALAMLETALVRDHKSVGQVAANLGALFNDVGRPTEAEPLLRRALTIALAQSQQDSVAIGIIEDNLGGLLRLSGRTGEARQSYARALARFESALPATHPRIAITRNNFGRFLIDIRAYAEAEGELKHALAMSEKIYSADSYETALPASNLAEAVAALGRPDEARALFQRAIAVMERTFGANHARLYRTLVKVGDFELSDKRPQAARTLFERAFAIELAQRKRTGNTRNDGRGSPGVSGQDAFRGLIEAIWQSGPDYRQSAASDALEAAQWDAMAPADVVLAALGAGGGAGDAALGALTRERQELASDWHQTDVELTGILGAPKMRDEKREMALRARLAATEVRIGEIDADLQARFPRYRDMAHPSALTANRLSNLLKPNEAAIQLIVMDRATHVFVVAENRIYWHRAPINGEDLRTMIGTLRCGLDHNEWQGSGLKRCAAGLGIDPKEAPAPGDPLPFDPELAHTLYKVLLDPARAAIAGKDLLIVASGALTLLPFDRLVTEQPLSRSLSQAGDVAWLTKRHAMTVLPSLSSLETLNFTTGSADAKSANSVVATPSVPPTDAAQPQIVSIQPQGVVAQGATSKPQAPPAQQQVTPAQPQATPAKPQAISAKPQETPAKPQAISAKPQETPAKPQATSAKPPATPAKPQAVSAKPPETPAKPQAISAKPPETPAKPPETPAKPQATSAKPPETPAKPQTTSAKPQANASQPQEEQSLVVPVQTAPGAAQPQAARSSRSRPEAAPQPERNLIDEGFGR